MGNSNEGDPVQFTTDGVAAVDRALSILAVFETGQTVLSLAQLSERSGLYKSTVLRLVASLKNAQMMTQTNDGRYRLGSRILRLATVYQNGVISRELIFPHMKDLAEVFGESIGFYAPEGNNQRICLYRINSNKTIVFNICPGDVTDLPVGSPGRVIAAFLGWQGQPYERIRADMIHYSQGERHSDLASISVPILGSDCEIIGSLTLGGPASRIDVGFYENAATTIMEAAAKITHSVGGNPIPLLAALEKRRAAQGIR